MAHKETHTRLWVANLQEDLSKEQVIHLFEKYGAIHNIVRKGNFASIEFENGSEALRCKRGLDQVDYHGRRLNIDWYRGDNFGKLEGTNWWGDKCGHPRFKHRVCVLGLPANINYQNVLDIAWEAGHSVVFIDIATSRCGFIYGIAEYAHYDDYKYAVDYLDGKQFKLNGGNVATLRFIKGDQLLSVERYVSENREKGFDESKTNYPPHPHPMQPMTHTMPPPNQPYPPQPMAPNQPYTHPYPPYYAPPPNYRPPLPAGPPPQ